MSIPDDQADLKMGPFKVIEVFTSNAPNDTEVAEALGTEVVPFDQIKHLCSDKPLVRFFRTDTQA